MEMLDTRAIAAPPATVWAALNDPEVLRQCIPGCETLEKVSDTEMRATVKLKIGPMTASFKGAVTLTDIDAPHGYTITGEGAGGAAGHARGSAVVRLEEQEGGTLLRYTAKAQVGGKLAQLGGRLIDATAKKLAGEFFDRFGQVVAPQAPVEPGEASPPKKGWTGLFKKG
jgi:uncharacterized protein